MVNRKKTRVLIIKLSAFGDIVISTPHVDLLMKRHQNDDVTLITGKAFVGLFSAFEFQNIYAISGQSLKQLLKAGWFVLTRRFDVVYDLQTNDRSALLVVLSFARKRIGMVRRFIYTDFGVLPGTSGHVFDRANALFKKLGFPAAVNHPVIGVSGHAEKRVSGWLDQNLDAEKFILIHAGSSPQWQSKRWPAEYFKQLAVNLGRAGVNVVWIGTDNERELNASLAQLAGINATDMFGFGELVELGRHALAAVVNDSGPMHLLAASQIPVYAIFGPTDYSRSHAVGQDDNVLLNPVSCSPCFLKSCPADKKHECMTGLTPEMVYQRIAKDLGLQADG